MQSFAGKLDFYSLLNCPSDAPNSAPVVRATWESDDGLRVFPWPAVSLQ
jgi:hypothetical protein